jgi:hypothetical protein
MDLTQSTFGSEPPPKSLTLSIIKDTPEASAWRVDIVDTAGKSMSYSWSGPVDGTLQPLKSADGQVVGKESLKRDGDALLRHGEDPSDGSSFDSRATMSADGNTITDVTTMNQRTARRRRRPPYIVEVPTQIEAASRSRRSLPWGRLCLWPARNRPDVRVWYDTEGT